MAIIECVPNVSEGRRAAVLAACAEAVRSAGATLLDLHADVDHNRSVYTYVGSTAVVVAATHALADVVVSAVDLRTHEGVHPRVGALDVVPFIPIQDSSLAECAATARGFAEQLALRHGLPVFLYEAAARLPYRQKLEDIRRGGVATLASRMQTPEWAPDFGPALPHASAGVSVVGARRPLVAYNINLASDRLDIASAIARAVRESSGGLPFVKAVGLRLAGRGLVQVSMNLTNLDVTSMRTVFDVVLSEAAARGVGVLESEIVGLVPAAALSDADAAHLRVTGYDGSQILERRL